MERLHDQNDLKAFLAGHSKRNITIVAAFASGTDDLLADLQENNRVEVIVGTINAFTSLDFIERASELLGQRMWVDFRGEDSIHWKLYLVSPNIVVIGSANFTGLGVSLRRDTCVVIRNRELYDDYMAQVRALKKTSGVLEATSPSFEAAKKRYEEQQRRNQAAMQAARATAQKKSTFSEWLKNGFVTIPLYVWDFEISEADKRVAREIIREKVTEPHKSTPIAKRKRPYRDALVVDSEGRRPPFASGTIVLTSGNRGGHIRFLQLDIVYRHPLKKQDYMIALFKTRYEEPFQLTDPIKKAIKAMIKDGECEGYSLSVDALCRRLSGRKKKTAR